LGELGGIGQSLDFAAPQHCGKHLGGFEARRVAKPQHGIAARLIIKVDRRRSAEQRAFCRRRSDWNRGQRRGGFGIEDRLVDLERAQGRGAAQQSSRSHCLRRHPQFPRSRPHRLGPLVVVSI
jgi:hypothetical protein